MDPGQDRESEDVLEFVKVNAFLGDFHRLMSWEGFAENAIESQREHLENLQIDIGGKAYSGREVYDFEEIANDFPRLLRYSLVVLVDSVVVAKLRHLCNVGAQRAGKVKRYEDINEGNEVDRARWFLGEILNARIEGSAIDWDLISKLRAFRNCIVHEAGKCNESRVASWGAHARQLEWKRGEVIVRPGYCRWIAEKALGLVEGLIKENRPHLDPY